MTRDLPARSARDATERPRSGDPPQSERMSAPRGRDASVLVLYKRYTGARSTVHALYKVGYVNAVNARAGSVTPPTYPRLTQ